MALYIPGQPCSICHKPIGTGEVVGLPPFTTNDADPLFLLSDGVFHRACLEAHSEVKRLQKRLKDFDRARSERVKICAVCGNEISNPDEYFTLGFLGEDERAKRWNYTNFHRDCLGLWADLPLVIRWTEWAVEVGGWTTDSIRWLAGKLSVATRNSQDTGRRGLLNEAKADDS